MLNLRVRSPKGVESLSNIEVTTTLATFQQQLAAVSKINPELQKLLIGFPPREIPTSNPDSTTLADLAIANNETITVQEKALAQVQASSTAEPAGGTKRKRDASKPTTTKSTKPKGQQAAVDGPVIHSLHGKIFGSSGTKKPAAKRQKRGGESASSSNETFGQAANRTLDEALLSAVSSEASANDDPLQKFLREGTSLALHEREKETMSTYRLEALHSGKYKFELFYKNQTLTSSGQPFFKVTFPTGKTMHEEEHEAFNKAELYGIISIIINKAQQQPAAAPAPVPAAPTAPVSAAPADSSNQEFSLELLKPYKMAFASPRVFWSLVYHFRYPEAGLKLMFPNFDWSFLDSRKREMSDRAKENEKMKLIYEKLDREEELTDEDLIAAGLIAAKPAPLVPAPVHAAAAAPDEHAAAEQGTSDQKIAAQPATI